MLESYLENNVSLTGILIRVEIDDDFQPVKEGIVFPNQFTIKKMFFNVKEIIKFLNKDIGFDLKWDIISNNGVTLSTRFIGVQDEKNTKNRMELYDSNSEGYIKKYAKGKISFWDVSVIIILHNINETYFYDFDESSWILIGID